MKRFQFKLDGVLKLRKFKEHKAKIELGSINKELEGVKREIIKLEKDVLEGYDSQSELLENIVNAKMVQFYPLYHEGKAHHIRILKKRSWNSEPIYHALFVLFLFLLPFLIVYLLSVLLNFVHVPYVLYYNSDRCLDMICKGFFIQYFRFSSCIFPWSGFF